MLRGGEISLKDLSESHGILSVLSHVDWSLQTVLQLEFLSFHWDDLNDWHIYNEFLRILSSENGLRNVPACSFQVESMDVASIFWSLFHSLVITDLGDHSIESRFIQWPLLLSASGLDQSSQIRLRNVESTEPHHYWFSNIDPIIVLLNPSTIVTHPCSQLLFSGWSESSPTVRKEPIE